MINDALFQTAKGMIKAEQNPKVACLILNNSKFDSDMWVNITNPKIYYRIKNLVQYSSIVTTNILDNLHDQVLCRVIVEVWKFGILIMLLITLRIAWVIRFSCY